MVAQLNADHDQKVAECARLQLKCDVTWEARMSVDPVVEEIRAIRERLAAQYDFDLGRIAEAARLNAIQEGRQTVCLPKRAPQGSSIETTTSADAIEA